jgi:hypothetical protein
MIIRIYLFIQIITATSSQAMSNVREGLDLSCWLSNDSTFTSETMAN